jgi:hypothetical protein
MKFDQDELESAVLCSVKEARGDGISACLAVLWVISNRSWTWNETVHQVVYGKNEFSSMSRPSDPQFNWEPKAPEDVAIYQAVKNAAAQILGQSGVDPTGKSHYYANLKTMDQNGWFARNIMADSTQHPLRVTIGKQSFFF